MLLAMARPQRSLVLTLENAYETLAISIPTVLDARTGALTKAACDRRLARWASRVITCAETDVEVAGRDHFDERQTYVVMSTHQSHYDSPILYWALGPSLQMIAKQELERVPIFGRAMRNAGFIFINRSNRKRAIERLKIAKRVLDEGTSVFIAPEGTRSRDGSLLPFKKGGFVLAQEMGVSILPITIEGTRVALPASSLLSRAGAKVRVTVHPAIKSEPALQGREQRAAWFQCVRDAIARPLRGSEPQSMVTPSR